MSALDDMVGIIPITVAAGVTMKVAEQMFPGQQSAPTRRKKKKGRRVAHPGNFSNIGL